MDWFSFPRHLCAPTAERRQAVPGSCSAFRLLSSSLLDVSFKLCFAVMPTKTCCC